MERWMIKYGTCVEARKEMQIFSVKAPFILLGDGSCSRCVCRE